ncbi:N-acetyltransferase family protein [Acinetobacter portensis]|uniref:N-acetyltransferase family protein n=1 Tax=Acinetobacter portensis TaxID=1839785 RepID=A0ABY4JZL2_9GAMM|nr:GNAT family N-acetyltransferase [Acinetobacter portensis]MCK7609267.1 N-acetyltransferase family protein [Acinetobacter portensis]MCK7640044.1 N-acetyltransferase family protein [Acinetobacter portensis]UPO23370.1 N-acetyltransferase family protein [Acinetobacter portensis]
MSYIIRPATEQDLPEILEIYNTEILNGLATWNEQPYDLKHLQIWLKQLQQQNFPVFVVKDSIKSKVSGYADYASFRNFSGYKYSVEHSVYISPEYVKQGLGKRLMQHLIEHAKFNNMHVMIAGIDHENIGSIELHKKLGFVQTGYMPQVGQKFGKWRDLVLMQLMLNNE